MAVNDGNATTYRTLPGHRPPRRRPGPTVIGQGANAQPGALVDPRMMFADVGLGSMGYGWPYAGGFGPVPALTQRQVGMGMGYDQNGRFTFEDTGPKPISPTTAGYLGLRDNGQGQYVDAAGNVRGLVDRATFGGAAHDPVDDFMANADWTRGMDPQYVRQQLRTITPEDYAGYAPEQQARIRAVLGYDPSASNGSSANPAARGAAPSAAGVPRPMPLPVAMPAGSPSMLKSGPAAAPARVNDVGLGTPNTTATGGYDPWARSRAMAPAISAGNAAARGATNMGSGALAPSVAGSGSAATKPAWGPAPASAAKPASPASDVGLSNPAVRRAPFTFGYANGGRVGKRRGAASGVSGSVKRMPVTIEGEARYADGGRPNINAEDPNNPLRAYLAGRPMSGSAGFNLNGALSTLLAGGGGYSTEGGDPAGPGRVTPEQLAWLREHGLTQDTQMESPVWAMNGQPFTVDGHTYQIDPTGDIRIDGKLYSQLNSLNVGGPGGVIDPNNRIYDPVFGLLTEPSNLNNIYDTGYGNGVFAVGGAMMAAPALAAAMGGASGGAAAASGGAAGDAPLVLAPGMEAQGMAESALLNAGVVPGSAEWVSTLGSMGLDTTAGGLYPAANGGGDLAAQLDANGSPYETNMYGPGGDPNAAASSVQNDIGLGTPPSGTPSGNGLQGYDGNVGGLDPETQSGLGGMDSAVDGITGAPGRLSQLADWIVAHPTQAARLFGGAASMIVSAGHGGGNSASIPLATPPGSGSGPGSATSGGAATIAPTPTAASTYTGIDPNFDPRQYLVSADLSNYNAVRGQFQPIESLLLEDAAKAGTPAEQEAAAGRAGADVEQAFADSERQQRNRMIAQGINPDAPGGAGVELARLSALDRAKSLAGQKNLARLNEKNRGYTQRLGASQLGAQLAQQGIAADSLGERAQEANQRAINDVGLNDANNRARISVADADRAARSATDAATIAERAREADLTSGLGYARLNADIASGNRSAERQSRQDEGTGIGNAINYGGQIISMGSDLGWWNEGGRIGADIGLPDGTVRGKRPRYYEEGGRVTKRAKNYDSGGAVSGPGTSTSDSVRARLSDGEHVLNAEAVELMDQTNPGALDQLNQQGLKIRAVRKALARGLDDVGLGG